MKPEAPTQTPQIVRHEHTHSYEFSESIGWTLFGCLIVIMGFTTLMVCQHLATERAKAAYAAGLVEENDKMSSTHYTKK